MLLSVFRAKISQMGPQNQLYLRHSLQRVTNLPDLTGVLKIPAVPRRPGQTRKEK